MNTNYFKHIQQCFNDVLNNNDNDLNNFVVDYQKSLNNNNEKGLLYGTFAAANVIDAHGDVYSNDEIERAAHNFMEINHRSFMGGLPGTSHRIKFPATLVESYVDKTDPNSWKWKGAVLIHDEKVRKQAREGNIIGFSIGGLANYDIRRN